MPKQQIHRASCIHEHLLPSFGPLAPCLVSELLHCYCRRCCCGCDCCSLVPKSWLKAPWRHRLRHALFREPMSYRNRLIFTHCTPRSANISTCLQGASEEFRPLLANQSALSLSAGMLSWRTILGCVSREGFTCCHGEPLRRVPGCC